MSEHFDVAVVGAGLVGAAIGYDLAAVGVRTVVLEAEGEPAAGASRSNSGIVHTGFDSKPGTLETRMIRSQAARWPTIFDSLGIPYRSTGALLAAADADEAARLPDMAEIAARNAVEVELLDGAQARQLEPRLAAEEGLLVPGESITDPYEVVRRLLGAGPETRLRWPVERVEENGEGLVISGPAGKVSAEFAVNCAGLYADEVAGDGSFQISPRRGEFAVFERGTADLVNHILLPMPNERTKGALVFPTLYGHLCAGPSAVDQEDKEDWYPRRDELETVRKRASKLLPEIKNLELTDSWAGLRTVGHPEDYIVRFSDRVPSMLHVAGIRSTGLSAALGLSQLALDMLGEHGLKERKRRESPQPTVVDSPGIPWWERLNAQRKIGELC